MVKMETKIDAVEK